MTTRSVFSSGWWRAIAVYLVLLTAVAVVLLMRCASPADAQEAPRREYVRVTFYTLPGRMADGERVYKGAAACSSWMPFGTQLMFDDGFVVTCHDRGHGDWYWRGWVDVWSPSYAWGVDNVRHAYGDYTWVQIIRWGWDE